MFDIGFFELCVIGVIALLVIGPEKLPRVARTVGLWTGKARGVIRTVKYDIDEQIRMEELKESMKRTASTVEKEFSESVNKVEDSFQEAQQEVNEEVASLKKSTEENS
ncbi:MAG: preprotein translocase subunit TatB [Cycloclasticus sp. symbiont of Poecilosclerida sp. M]|nr:MAG: preprotein translocase subunit TatB [Cycloclasticus sp. symbiont of Poecilosclerida sp. M]